MSGMPKPLDGWNTEKKESTARGIKLVGYSVSLVQKSTVKLWIKGENKWWNPENKVEYP